MLSEVGRRLYFGEDVVCAVNFLVLVLDVRLAMDDGCCAYVGSVPLACALGVLVTRIPPGIVDVFHQCKKSHNGGFGNH